MKKLTGLLCICLLAVCLCTACGDGESDPQTSAEVSTTEPEKATATPAPAFETITVFTIDPSSMSLKASRVKKKEDDDSLEYLAQLVLDNLEDDEIRLSGVEQEGDQAVIIFDSTGKPVKGCDEEMESLILECFANSILDNAEGVHGVIFRTDKGAYESENLSMEEDEVYASR